MKRTVLFILVALMCLAQRSRDDYRAAYRAWREADPTLERDSLNGGPAILQRADRLAAEAAKTAAARKLFLEGSAEDEAKQIAWLEAAALQPASPATSPKFEAQFIAAETATVTRTMDSFANNPDKGLQQLGQVLARERIALTALALAVAQRQKTAEAADGPLEASERARTGALELSRPMLQGLKEAEADFSREATAWAEYYRKIGEGARGEAAPITEVPPGVPPAVVNNPIAAPPTITPVPLARYVGTWSYPQANGLYHGPQPESFELVVEEQNGHAKGSLTAHFKIPAGDATDPALTFTFSGDFKSTRVQTFNLVTAEGAKGTVELIPGAAFNLLEVNFQTEPKPGKVRQSDAVLVKK